MSQWSDDPSGIDGTPGWAYTKDGYCVCCGNGRWKHHMPGCDLRDALDALEREKCPSRPAVKPAQRAQ